MTSKEVLAHVIRQQEEITYLRKQKANAIFYAEQIRKYYKTKDFNVAVSAEEIITRLKKEF